MHNYVMSSITRVYTHNNAHPDYDEPYGILVVALLVTRRRAPHEAMECAHLKIPSYAKYVFVQAAIRLSKIIMNDTGDIKKI